MSVLKHRRPSEIPAIKRLPVPEEKETERMTGRAEGWMRVRVFILADQGHNCGVLEKVI